LAAFGIYEYLAYAAEQLHAAGKLVMANGFGYGFRFMPTGLMLVATKSDGRANEMTSLSLTTDAFLLTANRFCRSTTNSLTVSSRAKSPKSISAGRSFTAFCPVALLPVRALFGNYWNTPEFHNRDRHLFRRYVPLIVRLCEAGWEPVTHAWSDNERVLVERFGRWSDGNLHFTIHNASDQLQNAIIAIDAAKLGLKERDARNLTIWVLTDLKTFLSLSAQRNFRH
jgi:hypothetical protein